MTIKLRENVLNVQMMKSYLYNSTVWLCVSRHLETMFASWKNAELNSFYEKRVKAPYPKFEHL